MNSILAMLVSGLETWKQYGFLNAAMEGAKVARALAGIALFPSLRSTRSEASARVAACEECDIFDRTTRTCGSPGGTMIQFRSGGQMASIKIGCWCPIDIASKVKKKKCWKGIMYGDGENRWKA